MEEEKKEQASKIVIKKVERGRAFKYTTFALLIVIVAGLGYFVYGDKLSFGDEIAAKVNGEKITVSELNRIYDSLPEQQKALMTKSDLLEQLVQLKVFYQEAKKEGFAVTENEANSNLDLLLVSAGITREQFVQNLAQQGINEEDFIISFIEQMTAERLINQSVLLNIKVSDAEVSSYYLSNVQQFQRGEQVTVKHALIGDENLSTVEKETKAKELLNKINKDNFCEYVTKYSTDLASVPACGEYTFGKEDPYVEEFKNLSFSQDEGDIGTANTQFGTHIIWTVKKLPPGTASFDEVSAQIKEFLAADKAKQDYETFYQDLKSKSKIKVYDLL
ncbi:MAG: SurA N-terminal domain-containing protein [Nanoarchaeota archaeon]